LDISPSAIFSGLIFGAIGIFIFRLGKRESHLPLLLIGIALMVYPYFTTGPLADWGVGALLCAAAFYFKE
jgi:hypothetical protein